MNHLRENPRDDLQALVSLVESEDLQILEEHGATFNPFDVLGRVHKEATHSAMLAWLLDPGGTHGFGADFLKLFVRLVARRAGERGDRHGAEHDGLTMPVRRPTLFEVDGWDLGSAEVRREWRHIDLLVIDLEHQFALVVENKVWSSEHSGQLLRYAGVTGRELGWCERYLHVYLTPSGDEASGERYVPVSYADVVGLLDRLLKSRSSTTAAEVLHFIERYRDTIEEHIMGDSELREICQRIYRNHKRAIDLIVEHMPDDQDLRYDLLTSIIEEDADLLAEKSELEKVRFVPKALDEVSRAPDEQRANGRLVLFELWNLKRRGVAMHVYLVPSDDATRDEVYEAARRYGSPFNTVRKGKPSSGWQRLLKQWVLSEDRLISADPEELEEVLREAVEGLKRGPIREVVEALSDLKRDGE